MVQINPENSSQENVNRLDKFLLKDREVCVNCHYW